MHHDNLLLLLNYNLRPLVMTSLLVSTSIIKPKLTRTTTFQISTEFGLLLDLQCTNPIVEGAAAKPHCHADVGLMRATNHWATYSAL
jgi:hypothetical protein